VSNKRASQDRKARLAEIQNQQKAKERKVKAGIGIALVVLLLGLGGVVAYAVNDAKSGQLPNLGVSVAAASCDPATTDSGGGTGEHVGPGTNKPDETSVKYDTVPPSHGPHFATPDVSGRDFYTAADRPPLETLVHNLEHGYTILWYDSTIADDRTAMDEIEAIADKFSGSSDNMRDKFIAAPWESTDENGAKFPDGQHVAFTHWSAGGTGQTDAAKQVGAFQYCSAPSGAALEDFMKKYPYFDSPEPGAM
jgi:hypothetical protein